MSQNVTKTTGNIGYILTEFEEKNTTEVAQLKGWLTGFKQREQ